MRFLVDGDGKNQGEAELVDKPQAYCREVLTEAYQDSTGIFEKPTKELILAAIDEKPVFARALAGEIMGFFKSKDVQIQAETEDARKNSDDS